MSAQKEIYALFWVFVLASTLVVVFCGLYLIFFRMNELLRNLSRSLYIKKIKWMADVGEGAGEIIYDGITK